MLTTNETRPQAVYRSGGLQLDKHLSTTCVGFQMERASRLLNLVISNSLCFHRGKILNHCSPAFYYNTNTEPKTFNRSTQTGCTKSTVNIKPAFAVLGYLCLHVYKDLSIYHACLCLSLAC